MNEITAIDLARLAVKLDADLWKDHKDTGPALHRALHIIRDAEAVLAQEREAQEQIRQLRAGALKMEPAIWQARVTEFRGDPRMLRALLAERIETSKVAASLFKDKTLTRITRAKMLQNLVAFAAAHGLQPPPTRNTDRFPVLDLVPADAGEQFAKRINEARREQYDQEIQCFKDDLAQPALPLAAVRWAVDTRARQLAENKKRTIPQSLRQRENQSDHDGESIQYRKVRRA
jgi:hypothetical protein